MNAFTFRMPAGIPGATSRLEHLTSEPQAIDATAALTAPLAFGKPMKTSATGLAQALVSGDSTALITGFLIRSYPGGASTDPLGTSTAPVAGTASRMKRGYMSVLLGNGTAAKDAPVYLRTTAATGPTRPVNNIEAAADASATKAAGGGNTGNGTMGAVVITTPAPPTPPAYIAGVYTVKFTAATAFQLIDPNGDVVGTGATGSAVNINGIGFTITAGGTAFVAGDTFTITITVNAGLIAGAFFTGPADASGNVEIAYNI